jgi:hypothetical protein
LGGYAYNEEFWAMIVVSETGPLSEKVFHLSFEEAIITQKVLDKIGSIAAVRVARAFAKSDLSSAAKYVRKIAEENSPCAKV